MPRVKNTNDNKQQKQDKKTKDLQSNGSDTESDRSSSPIPQPKVYPGTHWPLDCTLELLVNYEAVKEVRSVKTEFYPLVYHVTRTDYQNIARAVSKIQPIMDHIKPRIEKQKKNSLSPVSQKTEKEESKETKNCSVTKSSVGQEQNSNINDIASAKLHILKLLARINLKKHEFSKLLTWMQKLELRGGNRFSGQLYIFDASNEDADEPQPSSGKKSSGKAAVQCSGDAHQKEEEKTIVSTYSLRSPFLSQTEKKTSNINTRGDNTKDLLKVKIGDTKKVNSKTITDVKSNPTTGKSVKVVSPSRGASASRAASSSRGASSSKVSRGTSSSKSASSSSSRGGLSSRGAVSRGTRGKGRGAVNSRVERRGRPKKKLADTSSSSTDTESSSTETDQELGTNETKKSNAQSRLRKRISENTDTFCPNKQVRLGESEKTSGFVSPSASENPMPKLSPQVTAPKITQPSSSDNTPLSTPTSQVRFPGVLPPASYHGQLHVPSTSNPLRNILSYVYPALPGHRHQLDRPIPYPPPYPQQFSSLIPPPRIPGMSLPTSYGVNYNYLPRATAPGIPTTKSDSSVVTSQTSTTKEPVSSQAPAPVPLCLYRVEEGNVDRSSDSWLPPPKVEIDNAEDDPEYSHCFQRKDHDKEVDEFSTNKNTVDSSTSKSDDPPSPIIKTTCTGAVCGGDDCQHEHIIHMEDDSDDDNVEEVSVKGIKKEPCDGDVTIIDDHKEADAIIIIDDI